MQLEAFVDKFMNFFCADQVPSAGSRPAGYSCFIAGEANCGWAALLTTGRLEPISAGCAWYSGHSVENCYFLRGVGWEGGSWTLW